MFSPDGRRLAYGLQKKAEGWPDRTRLALRDLTTGATTVLTAPFDATAAGWSWTPDGGAIVFHAELRARTNLFTVPAAGGSPRLLVRGGTTAGAEATPGGAVVFQHHSVSEPPELAVVEADGSGFRKLTHVNDECMAAVAMGTMEEMTFKGAGGDDVQMFVVRPPGFDPGRKYPLVHLVHGGPQSASDTSYGRQHSYGGYPFTNLANVERWSPNRFSAGFNTPMLVLHGERDFRVPVTQGLELYGVLTAKGVPARLVYYPDENHWILKGQNSTHWYGEVLGWLARWL